MTDANLMDADCIHGNTWWGCPECDAEMASDPAISEQAEAE